MKVLLSGTSNAIIANGISAALAKDPRVAQFTNASYGASGTIAIGDHLQSTDFSQYDVCIIDYCVNEEAFLLMGITTLQSAVSNICNFVDAASRAGCLPVIAVFPSRDRLGLPAGSARPFEIALLETLQPLGVPSFNIYDYISSLSTRYGMEPVDLFLDATHVLRELGYFAGQEIVGYLSTVDFGTRRLRVTPKTYRPLTFVPFSDLEVVGPSHIVERSTRLMRRELLNISPGARVAYTHDGPVEFSGITLNAARSWGSLIDARTGRKVLEAGYQSLFSLKRDLTLISLPTKSPPKKGRWDKIRALLARLFDQGTGNASRRTDTATIELEYSADPLDGDDRPEPGLELSGLVLTELDKDRPLAVLAAQDKGMQIETQVPREREVTFAKELNSTITALKAS